jgi:hypothetical protein
MGRAAAAARVFKVRVLLGVDGRVLFEVSAQAAPAKAAA